jgi:hypothetical protein
VHSVAPLGELPREVASKCHLQRVNCLYAYVFESQPLSKSEDEQCQPSANYSQTKATNPYRPAYAPSPHCELDDGQKRKYLSFRKLQPPIASIHSLFGSDSFPAGSDGIQCSDEAEQYLQGYSGRNSSLASQSISSWNRLISWLKEMETLRQNAA